jgi:hypothetical protein
MLHALRSGCASCFPFDDRMDDGSNRGYRASRRRSSGRSQRGLPTGFHLEAEAVERLQRAGWAMLWDSPAYVAFLEDLDL